MLSGITHLSDISLLLLSRLGNSYLGASAHTCWDQGSFLCMSGAGCQTAVPSDWPATQTAGSVAYGPTTQDTSKYWCVNSHIKSSISWNHIMTFCVTVYAMCVFWDGFIFELIPAIMHLIDKVFHTWTKCCGWVVAFVAFDFSPLRTMVKYMNHSLWYWKTLYFAMEWVYVFFMILWISGDFFSKQLYLTGPFNGRRDSVFHEIGTEFLNVLRQTSGCR